MLKGRMVAIAMLGACVAPSTDGSGVGEAPQGIDAGTPESDGWGPDWPTGGVTSQDAVSAATTPESCEVTVTTETATEATVSGVVHCSGQALAIAQVGVGGTWGGWDSVIVGCHERFTLTLPLDPATGPGAWAMIDALEWDYTMDSGIVHCGTTGAP